MAYTKEDAKAAINILLKQMDFYVDNLEGHQVEEKLDAIVDSIDTLS